MFFRLAFTYIILSAAQILFYTDRFLLNFPRVLIFTLFSLVLMFSFQNNSKYSSFYYDSSYLISEGNASLIDNSQNLPKLAQSTAFPEITAVSFLAVDLNSNSILVDYNKDLQLPPASTTKILTALVAMDIYEGDEIIEIPSNCVQLNSTRAGFIALEKISFNDLLVSLLVGSAGDSACALSVSKVPYDDFISLMNSKARNLGMRNSNFVNPIGLDAEDNLQYSTSYDLYLLTQELRKSSYLTNIVKTTQHKLTSGAFERYSYNTNELLWNYSGTVGIKTGRTAAAKEVLVYEYLEDSTNVLIIVMGSDNRFLDTRNILEWVLQNYNFY